MAIAIGDRIPSATVGVMKKGSPDSLDTAEIFKGKKVLLFAVPGAFTPTCSARHLPGYIDHFEDFRAAGIDTVACMAVNDVYVMHAWAQQCGAQDLLMLADGNAAFSRALGLEADASAFLMGTRSQRFALLAEDGVVTRLFVEPPGEFRVSSAEHVLSTI
ncbi:MAG: peroxiredoxin [Gammaproteobacteria bacterium]|nr:peroxiredoxin [Gammaproteobacteria bacterium]MBT8050111.1 peroxiredoxin [Gammaproteobacteria bacterium]MBT8057242.1 peroxiredoxin [Gammaproteobacteria bacterium]NNJ78769.1 peroxiredoxin [Xanthomonadales bacterium]